MVIEIPRYCLRAYAMFFTKHGSIESFKQNELDWIVSQSMKKKIFFLLAKSGWIKKQGRNSYKCVKPENAIKGLLEFKVYNVIKEAKKPYAFTNLSAVEIWSDFVYIQRSREKSPYYVKILKKDVRYWKNFFNGNNVSYYFNRGSTIGEFVILIPVSSIKYSEKEGVKVETLKNTCSIAKNNEMYSYPYKYMRKKYGTVSA